MVHSMELPHVTAPQHELAIVAAMSVYALIPHAPTARVWKLSFTIVAACCSAFALSARLWDGLYRMGGWWIDSPGRAVVDRELTDMVARIAPTRPRYVPN